MQALQNWHMVNMAGYADKTPAKQANISSFNRHYCLDHKVDNLGKEGVAAMHKWALLEGFVKANLMGGLCTGKNWVWCAHKLLGIPSALTTETNLHTRFVAWLVQNDKDVSLRILKYLGPLVGERFWANYYNAACLYAIRDDIMDFLSNANLHYLASHNKVSPSLAHTLSLSVQLSLTHSLTHPHLCRRRTIT